jgi:hypothetical protein
MSYQVALYPKEMALRQQQSNDEDFFEKDEALVPFTQEQLASLQSRLLRYGYHLQNTDKWGIHFTNEEEGATALLTAGGLHFSASGEGIFEISMTASEFTDTGEFAKWDGQNEGWEEA